MFPKKITWSCSEILPKILKRFAHRFYFNPIHLLIWFSSSLANHYFFVEYNFSKNRCRYSLTHRQKHRPQKPPGFSPAIIQYFIQICIYLFWGIFPQNLLHVIFHKFPEDFSIFFQNFVNNFLVIASWIYQKVNNFWINRFHTTFTILFENWGNL